MSTAQLKQQAKEIEVEKIDKHQESVKVGITMVLNEILKSESKIPIRLQSKINNHFGQTFFSEIFDKFSKQYNL